MLESSVATAPALQTALAINNLSFAYPDGQVALRDVNLTIARGERVALVGPNGAGKSTLLLQLNGILRGTGHLEVLGRAVHDGHLGHIRAQVGFVFQNPDDQLFSPTVFDDVAFGPLYMGLPKEEILERVQRALAQVSMTGFEKRLPHHLSLGERKRIAIATVLAMDAEILALDEPSSGLDPRARRGLIELLRHFPHTMVVATHDMHLVRDLFSRTVILDGGQVVADGPTEEIISDRDLLERHGLELP
jgi:cobalt/nickel transport system ATP-binding protein